MILDLLINDTIDFDPDAVYNQAMNNKEKFKRYKEELIKGHFYDRIFAEVLEA